MILKLLSEGLWRGNKRLRYVFQVRNNRFGDCCFIFFNQKTKYLNLIKAEIYSNSIYMTVTQNAIINANTDK